jgi:hypothetical protein
MEEKNKALSYETYAIFHKRTDQNNIDLIFDSNQNKYEKINSSKQVR